MYNISLLFSLIFGNNYCIILLEVTTMIDINIIRNNRNLVEENLKKKFQEEKISILDEIISLDKRVRELKVSGDNLRQERNHTSDEIGLLFREKKARCYPGDISLRCAHL